MLVLILTSKSQHSTASDLQTGPQLATVHQAVQGCVCGSVEHGSITEMGRTRVSHFIN